MHALLVKHADKRHGVNGSLCHVHNKIWQSCGVQCCKRQPQEHRPSSREDWIALDSLA